MSFCSTSDECLRTVSVQVLELLLTANKLIVPEMKENCVRALVEAITVDSVMGIYDATTVTEVGYLRYPATLVYSIAPVSLTMRAIDSQIRIVFDA